MEFCLDCGRPLKIEKGIARCTCGFVKQSDSISFSEKINKPQERGKGTFKKEKNEGGFPHTCKKCGHEFADVVDLGVFYSDESSIHLFTCKKCGYVKREAYGTSNK